MAGGKEPERRKAESRLRLWLYGSALAAVCFGGGVVTGAVLEGPRLLIRWVREPVESVAVAPQRPAEPGRLERVAELHGDGPPRSGPPSEPASPAAADEPDAPGDAQATAAGLLATLRESVDSRGAAPGATEASGSKRVVQVAASPRLDEVRELQNRLSAAGFDAFLGPPPAAGDGQHRVRVRPARGQSIDDLAAKLTASGYSTWITSE